MFYMFFKEFKAFALRGNVIDLAVAVIIGAAFGQIVTSFVNDIVTPALLSPALKAANANKLEDLTCGEGIKYGKFIATIINFIVIAFAIFLMVKAANVMKKKKAEAPAASTLDQTLLTEIRDLLKK